MTKRPTDRTQRLWQVRWKNATRLARRDRELQAARESWLRAGRQTAVVARYERACELALEAHNLAEKLAILCVLQDR